MDSNVLIIFDTNRIRKTSKGEADYSDFSLGGDYPELLKFVKLNNLEKFIDLAIPEIVIDELEMQSKKSYFNDLEALENMKTRLAPIMGIFTKGRMAFDPDNHIRKNIEKYLADKGNVKILKMKKVDDILDHLKKKAFLVKKPFKNNGNGGFKDAILWENILHSDIFSKYETIYFFTENANDFEGCGTEFFKKHGKDFKIVVNYPQLEALLEEKYIDLIENISIFKFIKDDYFKDYVEKSTKDQRLNEINSGNFEDYKITDVEIKDICHDFEKIDKLREEEMDLYKIISLVKITLDNGQKKEILATTTIDEDRQFIDFEIEQ